MKDATKESSLDADSQVRDLRSQIDQLQAELTKATLEKNFLQRAMEDLNFHDNAHDGIVYTNADNEIVYANPYFLEMTGVGSAQDLLDQPFPTYMWKSDGEAARLLQDIKQDGFVRDREMALYNRAGEPVFAMCSGVASRDEDGNVIGTEIMFCNITSKRTVQAELVEQHALLDAMLVSTPDPTMILNGEMQIERSTPAAQQLFKLTSDPQAEEFYSVLARIGASGEDAEALQAKFSDGQAFVHQLEWHGRHLELHAAPLKANKRGWVCVIHDFTQRIRNEKVLHYHAYHDMLTQLPNRSYFQEKLDRIIQRAQKGEQRTFALLFIDLDKLKQVNDSFGHHVGDQFLIDFARRLEHCVRPGDIVARLGGDEFVVYLDDVADEEAAVRITERVHQSLREPFNLFEQHEVQSAASIGIALYDKSITSAEAMLRSADEAMYKAKKQGGNTFRI